AVIRLVDAGRSMACRASPHVLGALRTHDLLGNLQSGPAVDAASMQGRTLLIVGVLLDDVVAAEPRALGPGGRHQGLLVRELERVEQALVELGLDRLGFFPWAAEAQEPIIGVPDVPEPAERRVVRLSRRQLLCLPAQALGLFESPSHPFVPGGLQERHVRRIWPPTVPAIVCWEEDLLDELTQPIQIDMTEERAHHPALRRSAQRGVEAPVLQISRLEQVGEEPEDAVIMETLAANRQHDLVIQAIEAVRDIPFNKP